MNKPARSTAEIVILNEASAADDSALREAVSAAETVGHKLAAARKAKGLTLQAVHEGTKVKIAHLAAIELGDQSSLPAVPFAAGFVKAYAQFLGLNANEYSAAYKAEFGGVAPATAAPARPSQVLSAPAMIETPSTETAVAPPAQIDPPLAVIEPQPVEVLAPAPVAPPLLAATADEPAAAPSPARAKPAAPPDRFVAYFGIGAACLCVAWIGANAFLSKPASPTPTVTFTDVAPTKDAGTSAVAQEEGAAPADEPVVAEPAPAIDPATEEPRIAIVKPPKVKPAPKPSRAEDRAMTEIAIADAPVVSASSPAGPDGATAPFVDPFALPAISTPVAAEAIVPAKIVRSAAPKYPERCAARSKRAETVSVAFDVTVEGRPTNASVAESSNACFNDAAVETAYRMRFSPRTVDGQAQMEFGKRVTVQFTR
jgi:TonB family protein